MSGIKRFVRRAISVFRSGRAEADLAREITSHLQLLEDSFRAQGMSAEDARFAAKRAFGGVEQAKEHQREARAFRWMDEWWLDAKLGTRMLIKYPGLTLVGSLGMAVSIAIGACFFTVIYSYVQPTLPIDEGTGVVSIQNWDAESNSRESRSLHDYFIWKQELRSIQEIGAFRTVVHNLVVPGGTAEPVRIAEITASGFHIARVPALLGRTLVDGDERESAPPVVVIGYDVWRTRFSSDPAVVGRTIRLGNVVHTLVGVS